MKVLGSYPIGVNEQRALAGTATMELPRNNLRSFVLARAEIGDLFWVKEPWALIKSRAFGPQNVRDVIVGPVGTLPPEYLRRYIGQLRITPQSALTLERGDSRATLEVMAINEHAIRVQVHMVQIDKFLRAGRAA